MPGHGGIRTYDLWNASLMLCQLSYAVRSRVAQYHVAQYHVAQLAEHWASIPKVVGSNPTVARHIFQACPVWIYTQSSNYIHQMHNIYISVNNYCSSSEQLGHKGIDVFVRHKEIFPNYQMI